MKKSSNSKKIILPLAAVITVFFIFFSCSAVHAAGFAIIEQGVKGLGNAYAGGAAGAATGAILGESVGEYAGVGAVAKGLFVDQKGNAEINIPNYFAVGVYYKILEQLGAEIAYAWYGWSTFEKIDLVFEDDKLNQTIHEGYKNEYQLRFGAHYDVSESFQIRAGYIYDRTPQPIESVSPLLPDDTRSDFTFGFGYTTGKFKIDAGYMFVDIGRRSTIENGMGMNDNGFNGEYNSRADILMLSLGYSIR